MEITKLKSKGKNMSQVILLPTESYNNKKNAVDEAVEWDIEDAENYLKEHKDILFEKGKTYAINAFLPRGWRKVSNTQIFDEHVPNLKRKIYEEETENEGHVFALSIVEL